MRTPNVVTALRAGGGDSRKGWSFHHQRPLFKLSDGIKTRHTRVKSRAVPSPPRMAPRGPRALSRSSRGRSGGEQGDVLSGQGAPRHGAGRCMSGLVSDPHGFRPHALTDVRCQRLRREIYRRAHGPAPRAGTWGVRGAPGRLAVAPAQAAVPGPSRPGRGEAPRGLWGA